MPDAPDLDRDDGGFLSRWSRRKVQGRQAAAPAEPTAPTAAVAPQPPAVTAPAAGLASPVPPQGPPAVPGAAPAVPVAPAPPTLDDVAALTPESDFSRFVAPGVDSGVKNAALKRLFADPHFNVMDGLDTYIDDYGRPDPLPAGMLRQMAQSQVLGLFRDEPAPRPEPAAESGLEPDSDCPPAPAAPPDRPVLTSPPPR